MKFLVDECADVQLVNLLRGDGHDVIYVAETMRGAPDGVILSTAQKEQRITDVTLEGSFVVVDSERIRVRPLAS